MNQTFGSPWDNYHKWRRKAYEETYGLGSWEGKARMSKVPRGFEEFKDPFKTYWNNELSVGILESNNKFIGVACLVAKEVVDKENLHQR